MHKINSSIFRSFFAIILGITLLPVLNGATISQSGMFTGTTGSESYQSEFPGDPNSATFDRGVLPSFDRFDASLGTLTSVRISVEIAASADVGVTGIGIIDDEIPHSLSFELGAAVQAGIFYSPSSSVSTFTVASDLSSSFQLEEINFPSESGPFSDSIFETFGDFAIEGSVTVGELLVSDPNFALADFVGTGAVHGLDVGLFVPLGTTWNLDNLESGEADIDYSLQDGNVTLEYIFTPIPEPTSVALMLLGSGLVFGFFRFRKN